ncbi:hypothetical protein J2X20_001292 [Pelomonas saccharophila]|uniref:Uncharacterized protein n=1 Tax=Roseateles saccharophilus TaxID=304 RepID=A0ABU1YIW8_ROSSA|nr:hypothetical protein [Roseateles saccharophilus]MDR7268663.1 hypothetical protein [Roseateles saccharophilus]
MADKLFAAIDAKFPHWVYLRADHRIEMVANTSSMRHALEAAPNQAVPDRLVRMMLGLDRQAVEHHLLLSRD